MPPATEEDLKVVFWVGLMSGLALATLAFLA